MSTVLDSSLVALASDYASFGFLAAANNLWTWIAVISTAALSFWRIRASASSAISSRVGEDSPSLPPSSYREDEIAHADRSFSQPASCGSVEEESESGAPTSSSPPPWSPPWLGCDGSGATKGKLTTYYDWREDEPPPPAPVATTIDEAEFGGREWWRSRKRVVRLRNGEWEWYKFQDLRAINGNVVRLWGES